MFRSMVDYNSLSGFAAAAAGGLVYGLAYYALKFIGLCFVLVVEIRNRTR